MMNLFLGRLWAVFVFWVAGTFLVSGCGGKSVEGFKNAAAAHQPYVMQTSENDDRPDWAHQTMVEKGSQIYFSGGYLNGGDYALTVRCASAEAMKQVVQAISQFLRVEFSDYVHGSNTGAGSVDRYVSDGIAAVSKAVHVQGVKQSEVYYEQVMSVSEMQPTYNVFVRLVMDKSEFMKAKADALKALRDRFRDAGEVEAKEKAEDLLEELKRDIEA